MAYSFAPLHLLIYTLSTKCQPLKTKKPRIFFLGYFELDFTILDQSNLTSIDAWPCRLLSVDVVLTNAEVIVLSFSLLSLFILIFSMCQYFFKLFFRMMFFVAGIEPATHCLEGNCSTDELYNFWLKSSIFFFRLALFAHHGLTTRFGAWCWSRTNYEFVC